MSTEKDKQLDLKADHIQRIAAKHDLLIPISGGTTCSSTVKFEADLPAQLNPAKIAVLERELTAHFGQPVTFDTKHRRIVLVREDRQPVNLQDLVDHSRNRSDIPFGTAILGLCENGAPLLIKLSSDNIGHFLIAGVDQAVTSDLLLATTASLAMLHKPEQVKISAIDASGQHHFDRLNNTPKSLLHDVITDPHAAAEQLKGLEHLSQDRLQSHTTEPRVILAINDLSTLVGELPDTARTLKSILTHGPQAGIHVIADTNDPLGDVAKGFKAIASGKAANNSDLRHMSLVQKAETTTLDPDEFDVTTTKGDSVRFYAAHLY